MRIANDTSDYFPFIAFLFWGGEEREGRVKEGVKSSKRIMLKLVTR
jgi:hypothetical protein